MAYMSSFKRYVFKPTCPYWTEEDREREREEEREKERNKGVDLATLTWELQEGGFLDAQGNSPDPPAPGMCQKVHESCGHMCTKREEEECGLCEELVPVKPKNCAGSHLDIMKCHEVKAGKTVDCSYKVEYRKELDCGHPGRNAVLPCSIAKKLNIVEATLYCEAKCGKSLTDEGNDTLCGHKCQGKCGSCQNGRFHQRCGEKCGKLLICGHSCTAGCGTCGPCAQPCFYFCEHGGCPHECGVPCYWDCEEPCNYRCEHSKCTKLCSEVCDKPECNMPCTKLLQCGHACVGFCGEPCPPYCRICNPEQLLLGVFSGKTELVPNDRFIYLEDCKHAIEAESMNQWMQVKPETNEILPLRCPICRTRIMLIKRYSAIMFENREMINRIRETVFGDDYEILDQLDEIKEMLEKFREKVGYDVFHSSFEECLKDELSKPLYSAPGQDGSTFLSMSMEKVKFLKWLCTEWMDAVEVFEALEITVPEKLYLLLEERWRILLEEVKKRRWPLSSSELHFYQMERQRLDDTVTLYSRRMRTESNKRAFESFLKHDVKRQFFKAFDTMWKHEAYKPKLRNEFMVQYKVLLELLESKLEVTEEEQRQIVEAFGGRTGRWFKCPNGHVYIITECGGAMERSKCPECDEVIGGESHTLVASNKLAVEMDGAVEPLYPTLPPAPQQ